MKQYIIADEDSFSDISPIFAGEERCHASHEFGPAVRDYYLIHFCLSGRGVLKDKYGECEIEGGELFIIRPGEVTVYRADDRDPWHYMWIAFAGEKAAKFDTGRSVYPYSKELGAKLYELIERDDLVAERYLGVIYELMCELFYDRDEQPEARDRLHKVRKYIKYNYMYDLRVDALARDFGFERSYLYRIFKSRYGMSVKDYITKTKMQNAKKLLASGYAVGETARLVGYDDEFNFSKAYKKYYGISPSRVHAGEKN